MSFTSIVKNEISKLECEKSEYIAELCGFLINSAEIDKECVKIITENASVARRYFSLIKNLYNIVPRIIVRRQYNFNRNQAYILEYNNVKDLLEDLSLSKNNKINKYPDEYIISGDEEIKSYLRGCFISSGSVNDPKTARYHLEFLIKNEEQSILINKLLNQFDLKSKILHRTKGYMVYIKESEKISDFLRMLKAYSAVLYFEDIRIYRDHVNMTNRLNNCEQANVEKIINTANMQLEYIRILEENDALTLLDEKDKLVIEYRKKYPESSLLELSQIISIETNHKITKSGLNHRFRKIKDLALKLSKDV
ncbi:MAG: DNA-binding protein WhiA [Firmicutes bacterium]|nr:DNA-binding protein WhiA [Bacillota bacterium]